MPELRVVIPTLDEAETLPGLLEDLAAQQGVILEVVVADGGSSDATMALARAHGALCRSAPRGRARQMNAGAVGHRGGWLLFLHADSRLTHHHQLAVALADMHRCAGPTDAGHFALSFVGRNGPARGFLYRFMAAKTRSGRRYTINGDQGLLMPCVLFERLGGFDERLGFLEDQRMIAAIRRRGHMHCLAHPLETSTRRFVVEGPGRRYALMGLIMAMYSLDVPAFFDRAPGLYAEQARAERLVLRPYLALSARLVAEAAWPDIGCGLWRFVSLLTGQGWQLVLAAEILVGRDPAGTGRASPALRVEALIDHPLTRLLLFCLLLPVVFGTAVWLKWRDALGGPEPRPGTPDS